MTARAASPVAYPLRAFLDLSTGHLTHRTRRWLDGLDWVNEGPFGASTSYGWFIYAHDDDVCQPSAPHAPPGRFPADLWACMCRANELGADYLLFDCDAMEVEGLPVYDLVDGRDLIVPSSFA